VADASLGGVRRRLRRDLARALTLVEQHDLHYEVRNALVLHAVAAAAFLGYPAGFRLDPADPTWPVAFIELPDAGQVSWHLPQHPVPWDGHDTAEEDRRVRAFAASQEGPTDPPVLAGLLALAELTGEGGDPGDQGPGTDGDRGA